MARNKSGAPKTLKMFTFNNPKFSASKVMPGFGRKQNTALRNKPKQTR